MANISKIRINNVDYDLEDTTARAGSGIKQSIKTALLACFQKVAWIDSHGQDYYDALEAALNATEVISISAVFTQGSAVIYDTDSLDTLKQYLVVTATYDDSTTADVTALCTLSGTLTEGTSVITATYQGVTDTFNVTVTEALVPTGYTAYDYIYNSGTGNKAYVNTGIVLDKSWGELNLEFEAMNGNSTSNSDALLGSNTVTSSDVNNILWYARTNKAGFSAFNLGVAKQLASVPGDTRAVLKYYFVDGGESYMEWNGTTVAVATVSASSLSTNSRSLILHGGRTLSGTNDLYSCMNSKLGYVKFSDPSSGDVLYHFIPAKNESTGYYGFYEKVNKVFYPANNTYAKGGYWE